MRNIKQSETAEQKRIAPEKRSIEKLLLPLNKLADHSRHLLSKSFGNFENDGQTYQLPRYVYLGPKGGGDIIRIGIFATLHGDEPVGAVALQRLVWLLEQKRELGKGYALFLYPLCNPTGYEDNTRYKRGGKDLNREFWKGSVETEIRYLETEIWTHAFHGLIHLQSSQDSDGVHGFVNGTVLSEHLLKPALKEAENYLPRTSKTNIEGFPACNGIVYQTVAGALRAVPGLKPAPFELTLQTPGQAPQYLQVEALTAALQTVLLEYRHLLALAQNI
jgi:protein MpaA